MSTWVVGSLNVDLVVQVEQFPNPGETLRGTSFSTFLGGKGGNQAMALARLNAKPRVVGRVGSDDFGTRYRSALVETGADVSRVRTVNDQPTGTALIEVDPTGQNRIVVVPGANGRMDRDTVLEDLAEVTAGDVVLLQLEVPLDTVWAVAEHCHTSGATVILDPAPAAEIPERALPHISWITPNEHEASVITGIDTSSNDGLERACASLLESGVEHVVVKAGSRGAVYASKEQPTPRLVPGYRVDVVDTTAAGDSFNGGLAWALVERRPPEIAVRTGNATAAISVTGMGAQTAMPDAGAVLSLLENDR